MIRKLDRYLFFSFFFPFLLALVLIISMVMVVETTERLRRLLEYDGERPFLVVLGEYYLYQIPLLASMIAPVITLAGAIAALARLARQNELMAMQSVGISMKRIGMPLIIAGVICALASVYVQEIVVPHNARRAQRVSIELLKSRGQDAIIYKNVFAVDPGNEVWLVAGELDYTNNAIRDAIAEQSPGEDANRAPMFITYGKWKEPTTDKGEASHGAEDENAEKRGWYVTGYRFSFADESRRQLRREDFMQHFIETDLTPEELAEGAVDRMMRSLTELRRFAALFPDHHGSLELRTEMHRRLAYPLAHIILLLFAIPLVVESSGKTSVKGIGYALLVMGCYYVVTLGMLDFGNRGILAPWMAGWGPAAAFLFVGIWIYRRFKA